MYVATVMALRRRALPTPEVCAQVRLTKTSAQYLAIRSRRRELPYEAMLASGRKDWPVGEQVRVYRATGSRAGLLPVPEADEVGPSRPLSREEDPRDYDVEYYVRLLRETFAARLVRALEPGDYRAVFEDPGQPSLFAPSLAEAKPILTVLTEPGGPE